MLGSGGMGAVYKVSHRVTGKSFAVKWLLPQLTTGADTVQRFIREAQVAGRVDHPNVVEVYDVGQDGKSFFMVMELLNGEPLSQRMAAGQLSSAAACQIMIPVTRGLEVAHRAGVIHRDLKPENIFLCRSETGDEIPKVLDFGISKMSPLANDANAAITRAGTVMGTPHYMSPEQVRSLPVDARTDVYALGVIMYQMLSGELPYPGENLADLLVKIMTETPVPLGKLASHVPQGLIGIVTRAMAREQADRFGSVAEFGRALEPFCGLSASSPLLRRPTTGANNVPPTTGPIRTQPKRGATPPHGGFATPLSTESRQDPRSRHASGSHGSSGAPGTSRATLAVAAAAVGVLGLAVTLWSLTRPAAGENGGSSIGAAGPNADVPAEPRLPVRDEPRKPLSPPPPPPLPTKATNHPSFGAMPAHDFGADPMAPDDLPTTNTKLLPVPGNEPEIVAQPGNALPQRPNTQNTQNPDDDSQRVDPLQDPNNQGGADPYYGERLGSKPPRGKYGKNGQGNQGNHGNHGNKGSVIERTPPSPADAEQPSDEPKPKNSRTPRLNPNDF
ncbi:MAG: hypothetical protein RL701_6402 [Pseudomonadota bacterium]|jgi:serine/threonine-protein kinase